MTTRLQKLLNDYVEAKNRLDELRTEIPEAEQETSKAFKRLSLEVPVKETTLVELGGYLFTLYRPKDDYDLHMTAVSRDRSAKYHGGEE